MKEIKGRVPEIRFRGFPDDLVRCRYSKIEEMLIECGDPYQKINYQYFKQLSETVDRLTERSKISVSHSAQQIGEMGEFSLRVADLDKEELAEYQQLGHDSIGGCFIPSLFRGHRNAFYFPDFRNHSKDSEQFFDFTKQSIRNGMVDFRFVSSEECDLAQGLYLLSYLAEHYKELSPERYDQYLDSCHIFFESVMNGNNLVTELSCKIGRMLYAGCLDSEEFSCGFVRRYYSVFFKKEYDVIKKFRVLSMDQVMDVCIRTVEDDGRTYVYGSAAAVARLLVCAPLYDIEIPQDVREGAEFLIGLILHEPKVNYPYTDSATPDEDFAKNLSIVENITYTPSVSPVTLYNTLKHLYDHYADFQYMLGDSFNRWRLFFHLLRDYDLTAVSELMPPESVSTDEVFTDPNDVYAFLSYIAYGLSILGWIDNMPFCAPVRPLVEVGTLLEENPKEHQEEIDELLEEILDSENCPLDSYITAGIVVCVSVIAQAHRENGTDIMNALFPPTKLFRDSVDFSDERLKRVLNYADKTGMTESEQNKASRLAREKELAAENQRLAAENQKLQKQVEELEKKYADLSKQQEKEIAALTKKNREVAKKLEAEQKRSDIVPKKQYESLRAELESERARCLALEQQSAPSSDGVTLAFPSDEKELYEGEYHDHILNFLRENVEKGNAGKGRGKDILSAFLRANPEYGVLASRRSIVRNTMSGYRTMDAATEQQLESAGIRIRRGSGHIIIDLCGDERYTATLSSTNSDTRAGKNLASNIIKVMF